MRAKIRDTEIFFDIDGTSLVAEPSGMRERPTAFLIHGGPGVDHTSMKVGFGPLAQKMQILYLDHRGQGRSARGNPEKYTIDENVEDLEALRKYLGLGPIVSIGWSYGGVVAQAHAARYPDSVSHLVLVATICHFGFRKRAVELAEKVGTPKQVQYLKDLCAGKIDTVEKMIDYFLTMGNLYARKEDPGLTADALRSAFLSPDALNRAHAPDGTLATFDLRPELPKITAPTLVLAGRHDFICQPEQSEEMARLIPDSDLRIFEQSAHGLAGDEPQRFIDAISGFLVYKKRRQ